jgi:hypothetical protein
LKGKILVVRYSQHDDIITLTPGGMNKDIISSVEGPSIVGFTGFVDPLNLTEDVRNGNIYVSEYGGSGKITLLKPRAVLSVINNQHELISASLKPGGSPDIVSDQPGPRDNNSPGEIKATSSLSRVPSCDEPSGVLAPSLNDKISAGNGLRPTIYPNPVEKRFKVRFPVTYYGNTSIQIVDVVGRVYKGDNFTLPPGGSTVDMDISKLDLKAGVYFLKINSATSQTALIKLTLDRSF